MEPFYAFIPEYRKQLEKGAIQKAYKGVLDYMMGLRVYFESKYPDYFVSGSLYAGYMDMTYFSFIPKSLKERKLKIAVVFLHEAFRFEVWLSGYNRQVQTQTWKLIHESGWDRYRLVPPAKGVDSILEHTLVDGPDFCELDALTTQIEGETLKFIADVERFMDSLSA
jgi:hypothetical protein